MLIKCYENINIWIKRQRIFTSRKQEQILSMESIMLIFYSETIINEIIKWNLTICFLNISIVFLSLSFYNCNIMIEMIKRLNGTLKFWYKLYIHALLPISTKLFIISFSVATKTFSRAMCHFRHLSLLRFYSKAQNFTWVANNTYLRF